MPPGPWEEGQLVHAPKGHLHKHQTRPLLDQYAQSLDVGFLKVSRGLRF